MYLEEVCDEMDRGLKEFHVVNSDGTPVEPNMMEFSWDRILVAYLAMLKDRGDVVIGEMDYNPRKMNKNLIARFDVLAGKVNELVQIHGRKPHDDTP